jgi:ankyrin repeat protein
MNPSSSQTIAVVADAIPALPPGRQVQVLVQDEAAFVNRGLAILWRDAVGDSATHYSSACGLIARDDAVALGRLLHESPDLVDYRSADENGFQLLHYAASVGAVACIALLAEQGAPLEAPCGHVMPDGEGFQPGATALLLAVEHAHAAAVLRLLECGANARAFLSATHESALHLAAARGMDEVIEALVDAGAEVDALSDRHCFDDPLGLYLINTPLHVAALNDRAQAVRLLLKCGAERDVAGGDERTPVHYAAARGCLAALEVLLAAGADPDARDSVDIDGLPVHLAPLHYSILNSHTVAIAMLLCYGADPQVQSGRGESALQMAQRLGNEEIVANLVCALRNEPDSFFSQLDQQSIGWRFATYAEQRAFLWSLLAESPASNKSLLILSDWLAETLGAEQRPHLARAYRETLVKEVV